MFQTMVGHGFVFEELKHKHLNAFAVNSVSLIFVPTITLGLTHVVPREGRNPRVTRGGLGDGERIFGSISETLGNLVAHIGRITIVINTLEVDLVTEVLTVHGVGHLRDIANS